MEAVVAWKIKKHLTIYESGAPIVKVQMAKGFRLGKSIHINNILHTNLIRAAQEAKIMPRFYIFSLIFVLFVYPLIHANSYYVSDYYRTTSGTIGFSGVGRPLAGLLMGVISLHHWFLFDVAPMPQILAAVVIAFSVGMMSFCINYVDDFSKIISLSFIFCSFLFLQNLSYRYDSLSMAIAVSFSILPFLLRAKKEIFYIIEIAVCIFFSLGLYQPAENLFFVFTLFFFIYDLGAETLNNNFCILILRSLGAVIGLLLYKSQIYFVKPTGYGARHDVMTISPIVIFHNVESFLYYILWLSFQSRQTFVMLFLISVALIYLVAFYIYRSFSSKNLLNEVVFLLLGLIVMCLAAAGPMLFLKSPVIYPRVMIGFSGLFCTILILFQKYSSNALKNIFNFFVIFVLFSQFTLSYAYGNGLRLTFLSTQFMAHKISDGVDMLKNKNDLKVIFEGQMPQLKGIKNLEKQIPLFKFILPNGIDGVLFWQYKDNFIVPKSSLEEKKIKEAVRHAHVIQKVKTPLYTLYGYGKYAVVQFQ